MIRNLTRVAAIAVLLLALTPAALAAEQPVDLTESFTNAGVNIDKLQVSRIADIVIIRGRAADQAQAVAASLIASRLGYARVANLVQIVENNDVAIARAAERELTTHRSLDGCRFQVTADKGVIRVAGQVAHELQKDVAAAVLRNVDGARAVEMNLRNF